MIIDSQGSVSYNGEQIELLDEDRSGIAAPLCLAIKADRGRDSGSAVSLIVPGHKDDHTVQSVDWLTQ